MPASMEYQLNWTRALVRHVTGEEYGDGYRVTGVGVGYAEPGYHDSETVWVLGNWNPKRFPRGDEPPLTPDEAIMPRLADVLTSIGVEIEWLDEWTECSECYRIVRTQGDSYHWMASYTVGEYGYTCHECLKDDLEGAITGWGDEDASFVNNPRNAITFCSTSDVEALGFVKWEPGDEHTYESGWHPGQTDTPEPILDAILRRHPDAEVVFFLDEASQFYIRFSAYFRLPKVEDLADWEKELLANFDPVAHEAAMRSLVAEWDEK
jgi:hypothetical protein